METKEANTATKAFKTVGQSIKSGPLFSNQSVNRVNEAANVQKKYLQQIGAIKPKETPMAVIEEARNLAAKMGSEIEKLAEQYVSPHLIETINTVGYDKVALEVCRQDGTDYGPSSDLSLVKAATFLGTKLAMINKERNKILSGLSALSELK